MATNTTKYGFKKPDVTDLVSPIPFNDNFDLLESILGGLKFVVLTQIQYDALTTKDPTTIYFITA